MRRAGLVIWGLILGGAASLTAAVKDTSAAKIEIDPKEIARQKVEKNRAELKQIRLVDSVGWEKVKLIRRPDEPMERLEKERLRRKTGNWIG